jgi:hypothetical protein
MAKTWTARVTAMDATTKLAHQRMTVLELAEQLDTNHPNQRNLLDGFRNLAPTLNWGYVHGRCDTGSKA